MYRTRMTRRPSHPGEILEGLYMEPLGLSTSDLAFKLNVPAEELAKIIDGEAPMTVDMASRLGKEFSTTSESWLNIQRSLDDWLERQEKRSCKEASPVIGGRLIEEAAH